MIGTALSVLGQIAAAELLSQGATYAFSRPTTPKVKVQSNFFVEAFKAFVRSTLVALGLKKAGVEVDFVDCLIVILIYTFAIYAVYWVFSKIFGSKTKKRKK